MARFYGWTHATITNLSMEDYSMYAKAIQTIEAQEALLAIKTSNYHSFVDEDRSNIMRDLKRVAFPIGAEKEKIYTTEDAFKKLMGV